MYTSIHTVCTGCGTFHSHSSSLGCNIMSTYIRACKYVCTYSQTYILAFTTARTSNLGLILRVSHTHTHCSAIVCSYPCTHIPWEAKHSRLGWQSLVHTQHAYEVGQHSTAQYSTVQHSTARYSTVQHSTAHYSTVQHSTARYSTVQYSTA